MESVCPHPQGSGNRSSLCRSARSGKFPTRNRREDQSLLRGDPAKSKTDGVPDFRGCGDRPSTRNSADHGQYSGAVPDQADRARCCRCRVLNDQIPGGHGNSIGGLIVDGGNLDWAAHPQRQPALNTPDPSYHGAVWTEAVKPIGPIAYAIKARVTLQRDIGAALSPFNAFLTIQGLETLALRMREHCKNAQAVVEFLRT